MRLINAFAAQLFGSLEVRRHDPGVEFVLAFPKLGGNNEAKRKSDRAPSARRPKLNNAECGVNRWARVCDTRGIFRGFNCSTIKGAGNPAGLPSI
jgi:hypothetical protein